MLKRFIKDFKFVTQYDETIRKQIALVILGGSLVTIMVMAYAGSIRYNMDNLNTFTIIHAIVSIIAIIFFVYAVGLYYKK